LRDEDEKRAPPGRLSRPVRRRAGGGEKTSTSEGKTGNEAASTKEAFVRLDPAAFAERMNNSEAAVINVHIPYEGELEQTDAFIPYDKIIGDSSLPKDKNTEILLYCRSGRMSEEAGAALHEDGYTNVAHLEGGMKAWEAAGRKLVHNPAHVPAQAPIPMPKPLPHS
jgi:rhodanese-related sulfurtransferase